MTMSVLDWERSIKTVGSKIGNPSTYILDNIDSKATTLDSFLNAESKDQTIFEDLTKSDLKSIVREWQEKYS